MSAIAVSALVMAVAVSMFFDFISLCPLAILLAHLAPKVFRCNGLSLLCLEPCGRRFPKGSS